LLNAPLTKRLDAEVALARHGTVVVPALLTAFASAEAHDRAAIARVLGSIHDPSIAPMLARALDDDDATVGREAGAGLVELGRAGLHAALHTLIIHRHPSPQLKEAMRYLVHEVTADKDADILTPLRHALAEHAPNEVLMVEAYKAIAALGRTAS
jgi:hypothetical protein